MTINNHQSMNKLCLYFNTASSYRKAIYQEIDRTYDCNWYFGDGDSQGIKTLNNNYLKRVHYLKTYKISTSIIIQLGLVRLLFCRRYKTYLIIGEPRNISIWAMLVLRSLFFRGKRIYSWSHGYNSKRSKLFQRISKFFFKMFDGVFVYNDTNKQHMINDGITSKKLHVIHNSLDYNTQSKIRSELHATDVFKKHFNNTYPNLIFIGRLTRVKRLDIVIEAVNILKERGIYVNMTFIGDGVCKEELFNKSVEYGIDNNIWFYGESYNEVKNAELIYNADICVSPGNVGLTAIHALTFGTPVITNNNFELQMPEFETIKKDITGAFFEYNNAASLALEIEKWMQNNRDKRDLVRKACCNAIDTEWTPTYQINILKKHLRFN